MKERREKILSPSPLDRTEDRERTPAQLTQGFRVLESLWTSGLQPKDLRPQYFLTFFARWAGNATFMARSVGLNRNRVREIFGELSIATRTFPLRSLWLGLRDRYPKKPFLFRFLKFYAALGAKPALAPEQHQTLIRLWLMGFPFKILRAHYVFWAIQKGMALGAIADSLGVKTWTVERIRFEAAKRDSAPAYWLSPLQPRREDWYMNRMAKRGRRNQLDLSAPGPFPGKAPVSYPCRFLSRGTG